LFAISDLSQVEWQHILFFGSLFPWITPVAGEGWDSTAAPPVEGLVAPAGVAPSDWEKTTTVPAGVTLSDWE